MIAALYVAKGGTYYAPELAGIVDPWDEARDARLYDGPYPVVAHPPCARWGRYYFGGPSWVAGGRTPKVKGDDGGCFAAALAAVRKWGGVLEHPEASHAWAAFGLAAPPRGGGWVNADWLGGWTCCVEQGWYGHRARKATWLYAVGVELPSLKWGDCGKRVAWAVETRPSRRAVRTGLCQILLGRLRAATPVEFRDVLLAMARTAEGQKAAT